MTGMCAKFKEHVEAVGNLFPRSRKKIIEDALSKPNGGNSSVPGKNKKTKYLPVYKECCALQNKKNDNVNNS